MENGLSILEEFDAIAEIQTPHIFYKTSTEASQQRLASYVYSRNPEDVLLFNSTAFEIPAVFAGLTVEQISVIAKTAPKEYKEVILKSIRDNYFIEQAIKIAESLDSDAKLPGNPNKKRVISVIQYLINNLIVFKF